MRLSKIVFAATTSSLMLFPKYVKKRKENVRKADLTNISKFILNNVLIFFRLNIFSTFILIDVNFLQSPHFPIKVVTI